MRTVDLTASPFHRVLGADHGADRHRHRGGRRTTPLDLDGLPAGRARELREELLAPPTARRQGPTGEPATEAPPTRRRVVLRLDPAWARFAPLTSAGW